MTAYRYALAVIAAIMLFTCPVQAALLAYEDFESYTAGTNLNGGSGGTGFSNNWATVAGNVTVQSKSLTSPQIDGGSQAMRIKPEADGTNLDSVAFRDTFGPETGDVYMSVLLRVEGGGLDSGDFVNIQVSDGAAGNNTNTLSFGFRNTGGNPLFARVGSSGGGTTVDSSTNTVDSTTYLLVAKFSKDGGGQYGRTDLYINPSGYTEPGTADATAIDTDPTITQIDTFNIRIYNLDIADSVYLDGIRIGNTYASVIPEPATMGMLAVGGIGLLVRKRRK